MLNNIDIKINRYTGNKIIDSKLFKKYFSFVLLSHGYLQGEINGKKYTIHSPVVMCTAVNDKLENLVLGENSEIAVVLFKPGIINKAFDIENIYDFKCDDLCQQHQYMQLSPFFADNVENKCFSISQRGVQSYKKHIENLESSIYISESPFSFFQARSELCIILYFLENMRNKVVRKNKIDEKEREFCKIIEYVNENISKSITLKHLYEKFYISPDELEKLFIKYCGLTLRKYQRKKKLDISKDLLLLSSLTNKEIAMKIGFSTPQNFCKFFKNMTGVTPDSFRKEQIKCIYK